MHGSCNHVQRDAEECGADQRYLKVTCANFGYSKRRIFKRLLRRMGKKSTRVARKGRKASMEDCCVARISVIE